MFKFRKAKEEEPTAPGQGKQSQMVMTEFVSLIEDSVAFIYTFSVYTVLLQ